MAFVRTSLLFHLAVIAFYYQASALSILSTNEFEKGSTVTITCSADAVDVDNSVTNQIRALEMSRKTYASNEKKLFLRIDNTEALIDEEYLFEDYPAGGRFTAEFPTKDVLVAQKFQRDMLKAVVTISDANCADAAEYFCKVTYKAPDSGEIISVEEREMLNSTVIASGMKVVVVPDIARDGELSAAYEMNASISMTCSVEGPEDYKFFWKRRCPQEFTSNPPFLKYPYDNDLQGHRKEILIEQNGLANDCGVYKHTQELQFEMTKEMEKCMIRCDFGEDNNLSDNVMGNFTFLLQEVTVAGPTDKATSASSGSSTDLVIGLVVGLLLLFIIVAAVLIYVCWWRKRKPSEDKYKDQPDVGRGGDAHDHAPPPVFYSKPNKPPKNNARGDNKEEEKWNSKDRNASYDYDDDDELPPKAYYYDNNEEDVKGRNDDDQPPKQKYNSNRPRSRRRSQRGSGDYYNYDNTEDEYPGKSRNRSYGDGPDPNTGPNPYSGPNPYATSHDYSRSEDESESGRPRPKPKRRTQLPSTSSRENQDPPKEKELHYADLDLSKKTPRGDGTYDDGGGDNRGRYNRNRRDRKSRGHEDEEEQMPVQYASIRV